MIHLSFLLLLFQYCYLFILFIFLSFLSFIPLSKNLGTDGFIESVHNAYEYYELETVTNSDYEFTIAKGLIKNKCYYGVSFINEYPKTNKIVLRFDGATYDLPTTDYRNNSMVIALRSENKIEVILMQGSKEVLLKELPIFFPSSFDKENAFIGKGEGAPVEELKLAKMSSPIIRYAIYVSLGVILTSGLLILVLFLLRKGLFNKERRKVGVVDMKEIYERETKAIDPNEFIDDNISTPTEVVDTPSDDTYQITDVKEYLKQLGFNTNYSSLTVDEKNQIMLKLMYLKDNKMISLDSYYEETKELWS